MQEENTFVRFLQYDMIKERLMEEMKEWLFDNLVKDIEPDMHEMIKDISEAMSEGKSVQTNMRVEQVEDGLRVIFDYKIL